MIQQETILKVADVSEAEREKINQIIDRLASQGYRILGVAQSNFQGIEFPTDQQDLPFKLIGLVVFYDPPKSNIEQVMRASFACHDILNVFFTEGFAGSNF